jgi:hypothetical protein
MLVNTLACCYPFDREEKGCKMMLDFLGLGCQIMGCADAHQFCTKMLMLAGIRKITTGPKSSCILNVNTLTRLG